MVGVGKNYLGVSLIKDVAMEDALHRGSRSHGHKYRGVDHSVVGAQLARASLCLRCCML